MEIHASDDNAGEAADSVAVRSLMNSYTLLVAALDAAACAATRVLCYAAHQAHVDGPPIFLQAEPWEVLFTSFLPSSRIPFTAASSRFMGALPYLQRSQESMDRHSRIAD